MLVVSERPQHWAFLRDSLDEEMVSVGWARPSDVDAALAGGVPWAIAGTGTRPVPALAVFKGLFSCRWVGPYPDGLAVRPLVLPDWHAVLSSLRGALARNLYGLRLAPGAGLLLPGGSYTSRAPEIEVLLGMHPAGIEAAGPWLGPTARRVTAAIERLGLPLEVRHQGSTIALANRTVTTSSHSAERRDGSAA